VLATSLVQGPAIVLGALQRRAPFARLGAPHKVERRVTTGTAVELAGRALHHALALPEVSSLAADANPHNLLNRNVRGFLSGYIKAGTKARYFGREVITFGRYPAGVLGYDLLPDGAVLVELLVGYDAPVASRATPSLAPLRDAPSGSAPFVALTDVVAEPPEPAVVADAVASGVARRYQLTVTTVTISLDEEAPPELVDPPDNAALAALEVPIGRVEAAVWAGSSGPEVALRGDVLCARAALSAVERAAGLALRAGERLDERVLAPLLVAPFEGARPEDVLRALILAAERAGVC
jgi:hypothetical protein